MKRYVCIFFIFSGSYLYSSDWISYTSENSGLISNHVRAVCVDVNGLKWFGTDNGLSCFNGNTWQTFQAGTENPTLAHNQVNDIAFEQSSYGPEIWIATQGGVSVMGVELDAITQATPYRTDNTGLVSNSVSSVAVDEKHIRWFGTDKGISGFNGHSWASFTTETEEALSNNNVLSVGCSNTGWKYIGTKGSGVSRLYSESLDAVTSASPYDNDWSAGIWSDTVNAVLVNEDGSQWFAMNFGVAFHDTTETKAGWSSWQSDSGLVHNVVRAIARDHQGTMWFGTQGGVSRFTGTQWTNFTFEDGLAGNDIFDIAVDVDGTLWFATYYGVSHYLGTGAAVSKNGLQTCDVFKLSQNYPNPFNSSTWLRYELLQQGFVSVQIFNLRGECVKTLVNQHQMPGCYQLSWDGSSQGEAVATGVYLVSVHVSGTSGEWTDSKKILLLK